MERVQEPAAGRLPATVIPLRTPTRVPPLRLERAGRLAAVTGDWLFQACGVEGRVKLLREHELLAA